MSSLRNLDSPNQLPLPSYLSDQRGRSVTPIIVPTPPKLATTLTTTRLRPSSTSPAPPPLPRLGPGRPPKDGSAAASRAEHRDLAAPLRKLEAHQRAVGAVMERMGCVLASEERRSGFLDDEDFEGEVEESEDERWEGG